jgi:hypothetical protein
VEYSDTVLPYHIERCEALRVEEPELVSLRERAKELGIPRAAQMGEAKLREKIAEKEAELADLERGQKTLELRAKAAELGIEGVEEKDIETLTAEIEAKAKGGE